MRKRHSVIDPVILARAYDLVFGVSTPARSAGLTLNMEYWGSHSYFGKQPTHSAYASTSSATAHLKVGDTPTISTNSEFATRTDQASAATHIRHSSKPLIEVSVCFCDQFAPETILQASVVMNVAG